MSYISAEMVLDVIGRFKTCTPFYGLQRTSQTADTARVCIYADITDASYSRVRVCVFLYVCIYMCVHVDPPVCS